MEREVIEALRNFRKLSQEDFARNVGVATSTIANVEAGLRKPSKRLIYAISDIYPIDDEFLTFFESYKKMRKIIHDTNIQQI